MSQQTKAKFANANDFLHRPNGAILLQQSAKGEPILQTPEHKCRNALPVLAGSAVCHWGIAKHLGTCAGALTQSSCPEESIGLPAVMRSNIVHG